MTSNSKVIAGVIIPESSFFFVRNRLSLLMDFVKFERTILSFGSLECEGIIHQGDRAKFIVSCTAIRPREYHCHCLCQFVCGAAYKLTIEY